MTPITFAKGSSKGGGGIVSAIVSAVAGGGCGNGTHNGKRGFQPGNKCSSGKSKSDAVNSAKSAHTSASRTAKKHIKAGTVNTPAGRDSVRSAAQAHRALRDARVTHAANQKVARNAARRDARAAAAKPAAQANARLVQAHAQANPAKTPLAPKAAKPAATAKVAPTTAQRTATAAKEVGEIKTRKAADHLKAVRDRAESGNVQGVHREVDRIARGATKDQLFGAAKAAGIEHSATTKVALVQHLKDNLVAPPKGPAKAESLPIKDFADRVVKGAQATPTGGFGNAKTFINHVKAHLEKTDPAFKGMSDGAFKARLLEAQQARHLELGRADLVEAMHPADVRASDTPYLTANYHFIRHPEVEGKGQSRSKQAEKLARAAGGGR